MNSAEEIVKFWLQENNYFFQSSIKIEKSRGKEIDILAVDNKGIKRHIEVSVSIGMADYKNNSKTKAKFYHEKKFNHEKVKSEVEKRLGKTYTRELVVGDITLQKKNQLKEFTEECKKLGIQVIHISSILNEIIPKLGSGSQLNSAIKAIQIVSKFYNNENEKI